MNVLCQIFSWVEEELAWMKSDKEFLDLFCLQETANYHVVNCNNECLHVHFHVVCEKSVKNF